MIYGSVCSGIEAASVAWHPLGWRASFYSEIEPFPRAVLAHHYPQVPLHGDFTTIKAGDYEPIDLLVGGTPCQSFSIAGLRKGLDDPRGNLMLGFGALAQRLRPRWLVWENVPGVLSSNGGRDFGAFLGMLGVLGYGFAYRVLDAQYFGVPQRRRRVFVVGCLGDWRSAAAVLFERHSLQGHPAPRREAGKETAVGALAGTSPGGGWRVGADEAAAGQLVPTCGKQWPADVAPTLNAAFGDKQGLEDQHALGGTGYSYLPEISLCLNAGAMGRQDYETETLIGGGFDVAHTLRGTGFDASEDGTGRGTPLVPVPFDTTQITSPANYSNPQPGDPCHPLALGAHAPAIAFSCKDHGADAGGLAPTLRAMGYGASHANAGGQIAVLAFPANLSGTQCASTENLAPAMGAENPTAVAFALRGRDEGAQPEIHDDGSNVGALRAGSGGSSRDYIAASAVRRLTPRECERLQGFPDDYTLIPHRGKPAADGPRYKALGNSMAVPVMRWIGERIAAVHNITTADSTRSRAA